MDDFHDAIARLCSKEISRASRENDDGRAANVIAVLAAMLGRTAARVAKGDGPAIEKLLTGAENLATEEAADFARLLSLAARIKSGYAP
jgi:hypothetical protein